MLIHLTIYTGKRHVFRKIFDMFLNLTKTFTNLSNTFILINLLIIFWQSFDNLLIVSLLKTKTHETIVIPITAKQTTTAHTKTPKTTATILSKVFMKKQPTCKTFFDELHCVKSVQIRRFSGPYFPAFGLNSERYPYSVQMWENTDQKTSVIGHFSRSVYTHTYTVI